MMNLNMNHTNTFPTTTTTAAAAAVATAAAITTTAAAITTAITTTAAAAATATTPGSGGVVVDSLGKKKRGRPRKYDSEGNLRVSAKPKPSLSPQLQGFSLSPTSPSSSYSKRGRGGIAFDSTNFHFLASCGTAGGDFMPHVVTVHTGEDVAGKIFSFAQKGPIGICILSANGAISKGRFEILSLSGSFTVSDNGSISPTNGLSVSLAGPDGRVIGGGVAGLLTAAGPIQIVLGSFMPNGCKAQKRKYNRESNSGTKVPMDTMAAPSPRPISQQSSDAALIAADWNGSGDFSDHRPSPDINISLTDE
ncbi:hypothetical protein RIF29_39820 [Crotalaria pallida]|uniref:AT-hook motif nuclear-localized protein n=1 Tax=Crotalaria pallida TaxID=3830 RepID=A0AAN9E3L0_CROPI